MKAVFLDYQSLAPDSLNWQQLDTLPITWAYYDYTLPSEIQSRIADADIVLSNKVVLDKTLLESNRHIKLIVILATGTNNVDLPTAKACGIQVSNIVSYSTESVAQHTFACLLSLTNHLSHYRAAVQQGLWSESHTFTYLSPVIYQLQHKTMGIIGYGAIGQRVAEIANVLGMQVIVAESHRQQVKNNHRVPLTTLLSQSDVVSIHVPLAENTKNMIDTPQFQCMKDTAILLNMARGGVVNETALLAALINKQIASAASDVLTQEPPDKTHALLHYKADNLLITPHIAWASCEARQELVSQLFHIITGFLQQQKVNQVV